ncbi:hypothetical protein JWJ90_14275 [Desulfobulbus rhabdoformis]|uniref:hypothetical protein n=1 Tax=Desulfobulbus rhabdoformis TaxID=34032 RepID=UPI001963F147|nr:hypothetical protein [Desulfobulbus rhabdoformis]MBM9615447.1 hypothetical protein [Desulfobulbus rhabdoformis]
MKVNDSIALAIQNIKKEGLADIEVFTRIFELSMIKDKVEGLIVNAIKAHCLKPLKQFSVRQM